MDRRRQPRVELLLPVRLWGVDAYSQPFTQSASARNISQGGAVLQGIRRQILPGEVLDVQFGGDRAQYRVVWAGRKGTQQEGEIGLESLGLEPCIWNVNLSRCSQNVAEG
jgi:hypothetical protein